MPQVPEFTWDVDVTVKDRNGNPVIQHVADFVMFTRAEERHLANGRVQYLNPQRYFVQRGHIYDGSGRHVPTDQAPQWVLDEYSRTDPHTRRIVGLPLPEDIQRDREQSAADLLKQFDQLPDDLKQALAAKLAGQAPRIDEKAPKSLGGSDSEHPMYPQLKNDPEAPQPKTWTCEHCGATLPVTHKGVHIARYRRNGKCS